MTHTLATACSLGWLLLLPLALFAEALQPGYVLAANDWLLTNAYFRHLAGAGYAGPTNPNLFDQVFQFAPWHAVAWNAMREGSVALWNPDSYCGSPLLATMGASVLFPIRWLVAVLPFEAQAAASAVLRLWIAGAGAYFLMRHYGVSRAAAVVSGASFGLCGYMVVWIGHPHTNVAALLPWLILAGDRLVLADTPRVRLFATAALAVLVAVQFTGGHIESSVDVLFTLGLYCLARSIAAGEGRLAGRILPAIARTALWPGVAVATGTLLAAPQLLPFLEWLPLSHEIQLRGAGSFAWWSPAFLEHVASLPLLVFPRLFGDPSSGDAWPVALVGGNFNERVLYVGLVALVLAGIAWVELARRDRPAARRRWVAVWTIVGGVAFLRSIRAPVASWLEHLPLLELLDPTRNRLTIALALCLVAGAGYERLREEVSAGTRLAVPRWLASVVVPVAIAGAAYLAGVSAGVASIVAMAALVAVLSVTDPAAGVARRQRVLASAVSLTIAADLLYFGRGFNPTTSRDLFYPEHPALSPLGAGEAPFRVTALDWALDPDAHLLLGYADVRGMDYLTHWYARYMELTGDTAERDLSYGVLLAGVRSPLLRVLNIKYVLAAAGGGGAVEGSVRWRELDANLGIGELDPVQPRSFLVFEALRAPNDDVAAQVLRDAPPRVYDRVILSDAPDAPPMRAGTSDAGQRSRARVALVKAERESGIWEVETEAQAYLVTTESYYPGWHAYLDGERVRLHRANLAFRAVHVPAGRHRIEHRYEPRSFRWGIALGALGVAIVLALVGAAHAGSRARRPQLGRTESPARARDAA